VKVYLFYFIFSSIFFAHPADPSASASQQEAPLGGVLARSSSGVRICTFVPGKQVNWAQGTAAGGGANTGAGSFFFYFLADLAKLQAEALLGRRAQLQHTSGYVSIRQDTSAYVSIRQHSSAFVRIRQHKHSSHTSHTSGYVRIRQDSSGFVRIRQDSSAYASILQQSIRRRLLEEEALRRAQLRMLTYADVC
jgi:hypothetical protein